jgi:hypothetical protein
VVVMRADALAELYGVDESTIHRWERAGRLRAARRDPGGVKYWLRDEILADLTAPPDEPADEPADNRVTELVVASRRPRRRAVR